MRWIHSPLWDGVFLLSGLPIGLVLVFASPPIGLAFFAAAIVLETGHVLSPIVLTWTQPGLRLRAIKEWREWVVLPLVIITICLFAAPTKFNDVSTSTLFGVYWSWNIYHFGMQNFGVVSLWQGSRSYDTRVRTGLVCLTLTTLGMAVLPFVLGGSWYLLMAGVFSFNHWLTDLGLCSRVSRHHCLFLAGMLVLGCVGFVWLIPRADHVATQWIPWLISARWGIGFVHFLYSRWIWKTVTVKEIQCITA